MPIRKASEADIPRIIEMGSRSIAEGPYQKFLDDKPDVTKELAAKLIAMDSATVLVCESEGYVNGLFAFILFPHYFSGQLTAGEMMWYVEPEARIGGVALELLRTAEQTARDMGAKYMQLTAPTEQIGELYKYCGGYKKVEVSYQRKL